jgi:hypothetical protein
MRFSMALLGFGGVESLNSFEALGFLASLGAVRFLMP